MKTNIKFIRQYPFYGHVAFDVVYNTYRTYTFIDDRLPKTAYEFIGNADSAEQYDPVFKRWETIYTVSANA